MNTSIKISLVFLAAIGVGGASECSDSADRKDRQAVNKQQEQYSIGQPIPRFDWSLERDLVRQLYRARNEEVATHTVWRSNTGLIEGDCTSVGFGLPYDTSLTNPLKKVPGPAVIEQPEPNGIYASKNSMATWVMCVVSENGVVNTVPVYIESKVTVYPLPVNVDYETNRVTFSDQAPSVTIQGRK